MEEMAQTELCWKVCPATHNPKGRWCAWFVIILMGVLIVPTDPIVGLVLLTLFVGSLTSFLFSTTYQIDSDGLRAKFPVRTKYLTWKQVRRVKFFDDACYLFTRKKPSNLDGWSGIAVYFGSQKDEIIAAIKSHVREDIAT